MISTEGLKRGKRIQYPDLALIEVQYYYKDQNY